jgi:hypothetical protein
MDDQSPSQRTKPSYLGPPECFKLELACMNLYQAFGVGGGHVGIYLVGSVLQRPDFRDVDVVCIMDDAEFTALFPDAHWTADAASWEFDPRWLVMTVVISEWLGRQIDRRVDFKFQPMTYANKRHKGMRHPLGHRTVARRLEGRRGPEE